MRPFIRETFELWYWAVFCPSKLQERLNEWRPLYSGGARVNIQPSEMLLLRRVPTRLLQQHSLLTILTSAPLALAILFNANALDWILLPASVVSAYSVSLMAFSLGIHVPILIFFIYILKAPTIHSSLIYSTNLIPPFVQILFAAALLTFLLSIAWSMGRYIWDVEASIGRNRNMFPLVILSAVPLLVGTGSVITAAWFWDQSWTFSATVSVLIFFWLLTVLLTSRSQYRTKADAGDLITFRWMLVLLAGIITAILAGSVVSNVAGFLPVVAAATSSLVVVSIAVFSISSVGHDGGFLQDGPKIRRILITLVMVSVSIFMGIFMAGALGALIASLVMLPAVYFAIFCWLVSVFITPTEMKWKGYLIGATIMMSLGIPSHGWLVVIVLPVMLFGYCRFLPDYVLLSSIRLVTLIKGADETPVYWLYKLPPHISEILWIPLLDHDRLLIAGFQSDFSASMKIFQRMQASPFFGLRYTVNKARPKLIADQFVHLSNIEELQSIASWSHSKLSQLIPSPHQPLDNQGAEPRKSPTPLEDMALDIAVVLPHIQIISRDVNVALASGTASLRERGLVNCLDDLRDLERRLPEFGLEGAALTRWSPVFENLKSIVEEETEKQKRQAYDEIINPFQSGNPLLPERANLFKGRTKFADEIKRQLLDRSRPTLILHGPRRCGKTSFLYNLERLLPSEVIPIFIDLQEPAYTSGAPEFLLCLMKAISQKAPSPTIEVPSIKVMRHTTYPSFKEWLDRAMVVFGTRRILLCLDEFEKLGQAIDDRRVSIKVFDALRHLIQHNNQINFLFAGVQTLQELGPNWNSYFISLRPIEMVYLEREEAKELLTQPEPDFELKYADDVVDHILYLTHYHPYLIQLIGESLVKQANLNHTRKITQPILESALDDALTAGAPYFSNLWDEFTGKTAEEVVIGRRILLATAKKGPMPSLNNDVARAALNRLIRYHVIQRTGTRNRFEVPFVSTWVQTRAIIDA